MKDKNDDENVAESQKSAIDFLLRKAIDFNEWLNIGGPCTTARIRECIKRYSKVSARYALGSIYMLKDKERNRQKCG